MATEVLKLYCDESCHLQHDGCDVMVLGAICCGEDDVAAVVRHIKWLRNKHECYTELKWTKLINKQLGFYFELIDYFMDSGLRFKSTIVMDKKLLDHERYNDGSHGVFYYKMFYYTLRDFIKKDAWAKIYLDYMDTLGGGKVRKLEEILSSETRSKGVDAKITGHIIRSHESQLIQLCDMLIGAVAYRNRTDIEKKSVTKLAVVEHIEAKLCRSLEVATPPWEEKFNVFKFSPQGGQC